MKKIIELIENANDIAILSHIDEDCDAFGSSLALAEALRKKGKKVVYYLDKLIEKKLQFISDNYTVYSEKDKKHFDLVICLDSGDLSRLGKRAELLELADKTACIDHHYTNQGYCDENVIDANASSTSEMIYDLLCLMNIKITTQIAKCLYCGIMSDTGCLKYSCASPKTAIVISKLMEKGIDHADYCRRIFDIEEKGVIKLKGHIINTMESHFEGRVTLAWVDEDLLNEFNVCEKDTGNIVNLPRSVEGTEISVFIKKTEEKTKVSLRSNGKYNVGQIASILGGGGHEMAAGVSVGKISVEEAKEKILLAIGEVING